VTGRSSPTPRSREWIELWRVALVLVLVLASIVALPAHVSAHLGSTKRVRVHLTSFGADVIVELDPADIGWELDLADPDAPQWEDIDAAQDRVAAWMQRSMLLSSAGGACDASVGALERIESDISRDGWAVRVPIAYECPEPRRDLSLDDRAVFDGDPQHESLVAHDDGVTILRAGRQQVSLGQSPSTLDTALAFVGEGILHFATGFDHVLFVLGLLLGAGVVVQAKGTRAAGREVVLVISGFTLGHSITLALAALDVVRVSSRIVEPAIAASIVIVAVCTALRPEQRRALAILAAAFGLVHGLGFSSVLAESLPSRGRLVPLVAFNVGLELAQLAIVALALGPIAWASRKPWYRRVVVEGGSALVGLAGLGWLIERVLGL